MKSSNNPSQRLALVGKGGAGKSALTALMTRSLVQRGENRILVIDADPTMGLSHVLGVRAEKTLEDIRRTIINVGGRGNRQERESLVQGLEYHLLEALVEAGGFALLAMGQPQQSGCFCPANTLLKGTIESLSSQFDLVLIDCEAGLEQISRKVIGDLDWLIIVTDPTRRGFQTALDIKKAAARFTRARDIGLIVNRVKEGGQGIDHLIGDTPLHILGYIPEDETITEWDMAGRPIFNLPDRALSVRAMETILKEII
ncbi:MAG: AAA family ATPase [Thermodesulfobacteriota bacterium]